MSVCPGRNKAGTHNRIGEELVLGIVDSEEELVGTVMSPVGVYLLHTLVIFQLSLCQTL